MFQENIHYNVQKDIVLIDNIGIPGLILLVFGICLLYFLVKNFNSYTAEGEASRTKYIVVWLVVAFFQNAFNTLWGEFWTISYLMSLLEPDTNFVLFISFYLVSLLGFYFIFMSAYSFFATINRKKVIPYIWLSSVLGVFLGIGSLSSIDNLDLYPNFLSYNLTGLIIFQLVYIGLISKWVKRNPGFRPVAGETNNQPQRRKHPTITKSQTERETPLNQVDKGETLSRTEISEIEVNLSKVTDESTENTSYSKCVEKPKLPVEGKGFKGGENDTIFMKKDVKVEIANLPGSGIRQQEVADTLYAACKFGNIDEIIFILPKLGFTIISSLSPFELKDKNGTVEKLYGEKELINFSIKLTRN